MNIISLGAGVQSSAMLLMALEGRFGDAPQCAIFADTQWEPKAVYEWLDVLEREVAPFPIHRVTAGNIRDDATAGTVPSANSTSRFVAIPFYTRDANGGIGMGRRQCSKEYKITPVRQWIRANCKGPVDVAIGISTDEAHRMKPSRVQYIRNIFPLLDANLSREDCANYLKSRMGKVAPKSSCIGCPFHGEQWWANMKAESPEEFADAVAFDDQIRNSGRGDVLQFVHRLAVRLGDIKEFKHENQGRMFMDGFGNECEGVCGL